MAGAAQVAIIGDGPAALITLAVLHDQGLPLEAMAVYGDNPRPMATMAGYMRSVRQRYMRSEADGHLSPRNFPDLALLDAWQQRSPLPMLASLIDRYTPTCELLLEHADALATSLQFQERKVYTRVAAVLRDEDSTGSFLLYDAEGKQQGAARHVVLALGHPGLRWPEAALPWRTHECVSHAYQNPVLQAGEQLVICGGGMAAAHLWLAALDSGAHVIALHRRRLRRQQLNAPRCSFSAAGIDTFRSLDSVGRRTWLRGAGGSFAYRRDWEARLAQARRAGTFTDQLGELSRIELGTSNTRQTGRLLLHLSDGVTLTANRLICATGFHSDMLRHGLIRQLVDTYGLPVQDGILQPDDDFTLKPLSRPNSICAVVGMLSRWALPVADTFVGMKYAARRLAPMLL